MSKRLLATSRIKATESKKSGVSSITGLSIAVLVCITLFLIFSQAPLEQREMFVDTAPTVSYSTFEV